MDEVGCAVDYIIPEFSMHSKTTTTMMRRTVMTDNDDVPFVVVVVSLYEDHDDKITCTTQRLSSQGGNYDGILFASGLLQTVIYRYKLNMKSHVVYFICNFVYHCKAQLETSLM